ncbi:MAG: YlxM family DNA-binding protein [Bacilli bacterium]|nr:YlxM family DNA-binding protein [Bacilli bacterium]
MDDFEKNLRINLLLDFYGNLLTDKQLETLQLYFREDLSLQEIANIYQVSRNAVYDNIQKAIKLLETYENKLQLLAKFEKRKELIQRIRDTFKDEQLEIYLKELEQLD